MWNSCSTLTVNIYFGIILYFNISVFQIELKCSLTAVAGSGTLGEQTQGWSHGLRDRKRQEETGRGKTKPSRIIILIKG